MPLKYDLTMRASIGYLCTDQGRERLRESGAEVNLLSFDEKERCKIGEEPEYIINSLVFWQPLPHLVHAHPSVSATAVRHDTIFAAQRDAKGRGEAMSIDSSYCRNCIYYEGIGHM